MNKRAKKRLAAIILVCLFLVGGLGIQRIMAQTFAQDYYDEETGHWIRGEIWDKVQSTPNWLQIYGHPISSMFMDSNGVQIQYFQKVRFELHPAAPEGQRVQISPLGKYVYKPGNPTAANDDSAACQTFPENGFRVCFTLLKFFLENGGVEQFGIPISNAESHNGLTVQYFEQARLEWHPELPDGKRVVVGDLGAEYFSARGEDQSLKLPETNENSTTSGILRLKVRAYPRTAVTGMRGTQSVYVIVEDQKSQAVEGVSVKIFVRLPSGEELEVTAPKLTDSNGITEVEFDFDESELGICTIEVQALQQNLNLAGETVTSFRVWR